MQSTILVEEIFHPPPPVRVRLLLEQYLLSFFWRRKSACVGVEGGGKGGRRGEGRE